MKILNIKEQAFGALSPQGQIDSCLSGKDPARPSWAFDSRMRFMQPPANRRYGASAFREAMVSLEQGDRPREDGNPDGQFKFTK